MRYKKYYIMEPEPFKYPQLEEDRSQQRVEEEIQLYERLKTSERLTEVDGGLAYFLVNTKWVDKWRNFIAHGGPYPGKVDNEPIARLIA